MSRSQGQSHGVWSMALVPAAVTALVFTPELVTNPEQTSRLGISGSLLWAALLFTSAPTTAWMMTRRRRPTRLSPLLLGVGLAQLTTAVVLVRLDTWLEVRSGYLLAGSGEEAMSYGIGFVISVMGGLLLAALCMAGVGIGARRTPAKAQLQTRAR